MKTIVIKKNVKFDFGGSFGVDEGTCGTCNGGNFGIAMDQSKKKFW